MDGNIEKMKMLLFSIGILLLCSCNEKAKIELDQTFWRTHSNSYAMEGFRENDLIIDKFYNPYLIFGFKRDSLQFCNPLKLGNKTVYNILYELEANKITLYLSSEGVIRSFNFASPNDTLIILSLISDRSQQITLTKVHYKFISMSRFEKIRLTIHSSCDSPYDCNISTMEIDKNQQIVLFERDSISKNINFYEELAIENEDYNNLLERISISNFVDCNSIYRDKRFDIPNYDVIINVGDTSKIIKLYGKESSPPNFRCLLEYLLYTGANYSKHFPQQSPLN